MPVPPASGGTCGAQSPAARTSSCSCASSASPSSSWRSIALSFGSTRSAMNARPARGARSAGPMRSLPWALASHAMKLGFYMGYAQPGTSPLELLELAQRGGDARLRLCVGGRGVGRRRDHAAGVARRADDDAEARHGDHAAARPLARERGDDGGDARHALGRPVPDGARHLGPAGRRGLARAGVGEAARQDTRVRRDRARDPAARAPRASRRALRHPGAGRDGTRQAAEADGAAAAQRTSRSISRRSRRRRSSRRSRSRTAGCRSSGRRRRRATCSRSTGRARGSTSRRRYRRS